MPTLYIYSIHTVLYQERQTMLQQVVQMIREIAIKHNYEVSLVFLTKPDPPMIDVKSIEARVSYKPTNDSLFDANMPVLSIQQISQLLKHEAVWNKVLQNGCKNPDDLHLILEDDVIIVEDSKDFIHQFFESKGRFDKVWDLLFLGLMSGNTQEPFGLRSTQTEYRVLPCKEAYFITPKTAFKLKGGLTTIRFDTRLYLSYMIATQNMDAYYLNKRFTVDTSKFGFVPSTVRVNNELILNSDAMQLVDMTKQTPNDGDSYLAKARTLFESLQKIQSPNVIHSYAQCHIQAKKYTEAMALLEQAIQLLQMRKGCIGNNSAMVQDMIRLHSFTQPDLPELLSKKSKWLKVEPIQA